MSTNVHQDTLTLLHLKPVLSVIRNVRNAIPMAQENATVANVCLAMGYLRNTSVVLAQLHQIARLVLLIQMCVRHVMTVGASLVAYVKNVQPQAARLAHQTSLSVTLAPVDGVSMELTVSNVMFTVQPAVLPLGLTSVTATVVQLDITMTLPILYARLVMPTVFNVPKIYLANAILGTVKLDLVSAQRR